MASNNWWNGKGFHSRSISFPLSCILESAYGDNVPFTLYHDSAVAGENFGLIFNVHHTTFDAYDRGIAHTAIIDDWIADKHWHCDAGVGGNRDWWTGEQSATPPITKSVLMWRLAENIHVKVDGIERVNEANSEAGNVVCLGLIRSSVGGFGTERVYAFKIRKYVSPEPQHGVWGEEEHSAVSIIWHCEGSAWWFYSAGWPNETNEANAVCNYIYDLYCNYRNYAWISHYAGESASESNIYAVTEASNYYEYGTVFTYAHGGHWWINGTIWIPPSQYYYVPVMHYKFYALEGEEVWDYELFEYTWSGNQKFVFQWTCGQAEEIGWYDYSWYEPPVYYFGTGAVGRAYSWTRQDETVLSFYGYSNPDSTEYCFIGFEGFSKPLSDDATDTYTYGDFVEKFYQYALQDNYTIKEALNAASEDIWGCNFGNCTLYNGYWDYLPPPFYWQFGKMHVFGNSYNTISQ